MLVLKFKMAVKYCDHVRRGPQKDWEEKKGIFSDNGPAPKVYYCKLTSDRCVGDTESLFPHSDHMLADAYQRCPSRTLTERLEND